MNFFDGFIYQNIHSSNDPKGRNQMLKKQSSGPQIGSAQDE